MISGGNGKQFTKIRLILVVKFGDDPKLDVLTRLLKP